MGTWSIYYIHRILSLSVITLSDAHWSDVIVFKLITHYWSFLIIQITVFNDFLSSCLLSKPTSAQFAIVNGKRWRQKAETWEKLQKWRQTEPRLTPRSVLPVLNLQLNLKREKIPRNLKRYSSRIINNQEVKQYCFAHISVLHINDFQRAMLATSF